MILTGCSLAALFLASLPGGQDEETLRREARSILAENCFDCHGPDAHARKAKLRLDVRQGLFREDEGTRIVVPGDPEKSELFARVTASDTDELMPPPKSGRSLTPAQIDTLRAWIQAGAPWGKHWAFVPPRRTDAPKVLTADWVRDPIDAYILARLEAKGLGPSPAAPNEILFRRLHLDLLGLPPTVEDVDRFLKECGSTGVPDDVYARWVDRLLASPHFGERWGRHWLDLARYADSDGYEDDKTRPDAWRFRDWVISAINRDLPFDQFTVAQLAGDLVPNATYEQKVASGFHRMAAFNRVAVGKPNEEEFRVKHMKERVSTTATAWLGLTLGCAECHDHKYDPLSQREYYRFYAFFNSQADAEIDAPALPERYKLAYERKKKVFDEAQALAKKAKAALEAFEQEVMPARIVRWAGTVNVSEIPADVAEVLACEPEKRTQRDLDRLTAYYRSTDPDYLRLKGELVRFEQLGNNKPNPPSTKALSLMRRPEMRRTFLQVRGNFEDRGEELRAGVPAAIPAPDEGVPTRLALARWIADAGNPLTARVAVNHVWKHLFGRGLVATPENFGSQGETPSHPKLLDRLAVEFAEDGWSRKRLIRRIVTSSTYRQSSRRRPGAAKLDPENRLLFRQNRIRVEAEIVRDLGLAASGLINRGLGGPAIQPPLPASLLKRPELRNERLMLPSEGRERYRRGVYINVQRTFPYPMLKDFDTADSNASCPLRDRSTTPLQALTLLNDPVFAECARGVGLRVLKECAGDVETRVIHAFRLCLSRTPTRAERRAILSVYESHLELYDERPELAAALMKGADLPRGVDPTEAAAWAAVGRTLLNVDEFITRE